MVADAASAHGWEGGRERRAWSGKEGECGRAYIGVDLPPVRRFLHRNQRWTEPAGVKAPVGEGVHVSRGHGRGRGRVEVLCAVLVGLGLESKSRRLKERYGVRVTLDFTPRESGGAAAAVYGGPFAQKLFAHTYREI